MKHKLFHLIDHTRDNKMHTVDSAHLLQFNGGDKDIHGNKIEDYVEKCNVNDRFVCEIHCYSLTCIEVEDTKKSYSIPLIYESFVRIDVEANNVKEACAIALNKFLSIPDDSYLEDSFRFDWEGIDTTEELPTTDEIIELVFK